MSNIKSQHHVVSLSAGTMLLLGILMMISGAVTLMIHSRYSKDEDERKPRLLRRIGDATDQVVEADIGDVNMSAVNESKEGMLSNIRSRSLSRRSNLWGRFAARAQGRSSRLCQRRSLVLSSRGMSSCGGSNARPSLPYQPATPNQPRTPGLEPLAPLSPLNQPRPTPDIKPSQASDPGGSVGDISDDVRVEDASPSKSFTEPEFAGSSEPIIGKPPGCGAGYDCPATEAAPIRATSDPGPEAKKSARNHEDSRLLGGVPDFILESVREGREDSAAVILNTQQIKSPVDYIPGKGFSPLRNDAEFFQKLIADSNAEKEEADEEWLEGHRRYVERKKAAQQEDDSELEGLGEVSLISAREMKSDAPDEVTSDEVTSDEVTSDAHDATQVAEQIIQQQIAEWPNEEDMEIITFFSHADWSDRPEEARLVECMRSEEFKEFMEPRMFKHIRASDELYKARFADLVPESVFPALMVQWPNGGAYYAVCGDNVPLSGRHLVGDIRQARSQDPILESSYELDLGSDDLFDEQEVEPDFISPFFVNEQDGDYVEMRVRDAVSRVILMGGIALCVLFMLITVPFAVLIFYIIRPSKGKE